jgi:hypothetical protein
MLKILLFDMDGVLLEAHGYHRALQDTVSLVAASLGFENTILTPDDIAAFESSGVTSEWDSSAICACLLLKEAWRIDPGRELPTYLPKAPVDLLGVGAPDFISFAASMGDPKMKSLRPRERAEQLILSDTTNLKASHKSIIRSILGNARQINSSLTHRIFQELILGSSEFIQTYNLEPFFDSESYLGMYDSPTLSRVHLDGLIDWLQLPGHSGVILTNRPSSAPQGYFCTSEAEIGARLVGLETLPIAGFGGLTWLSHSRGQGQEAYIKPSPVHALTALRLALGDTQEDALRAAASLAMDNQLAPSWQKLQGAQVTVFEDTIGGIESMVTAKECLRAVDIHLVTNFFGVSTNHQKRRSLQSTGASLYPTLSSALKAASIIP